MVHASSIVKLTKSAAAGKGVHRLEDMKVEEVSMVDRAANKRSFLVVKRDGGSPTDGETMTTEVRPNGKGGFSAARKGSRSLARKATYEVPPGFKEMVGPLLLKATEVLEMLVTDLDGAAVSEVGEDGSVPGVPAEFVAGLAQVGGMLEKAGSMFPAASEEPEMDPDAAEESPEEDMGESPDAETAELQMRAAADNFAKVFGAPLSKSSKARLLKVGAKMSKERFTRLHQAYQVLGTLIGELSPQAPAGSPPIGKTQKGLSPELTATLSKLTETITSLTSVVKAQGGDIAALQKSRRASSGAIVENESPAPRAAFSWPMDISAPITRETVGKNDGFFDED